MKTVRLLLTAVMTLAFTAFVYVVASDVRELLDLATHAEAQSEKLAVLEKARLKKGCK